MRILSILLVALSLLTICESVSGVELKYRTRLKPSDYMFGSRGNHKDPVFDNFRVIDLNFELGVESDCGRINFKNTLQASLKNILNTKYLEDLGKNILAASPMLAACYFSPTWCAILKQSQIRAGQLSKLRLDQCALIDKYVDGRVDDYYRERQAKTRESIHRNGGNLEDALDRANSGNYWDTDLKNWAGAAFGSKASENKLIGSSAKWAGLNSGEANSVVNLVKSFVGDTVISRGGVSVDFGPRRKPLTTQTYLRSLRKATYEKLCGNIIRKVENPGTTTTPENIVSKKELEELSPGFRRLLIDRQTIRSLALMPPNKRAHACRKLSEALSMTVFARDVSRSVEVLSIASGNPNLPDHRKKELDRKRRRLKDSLEMTVTLDRQKSEPLNRVMARINEEGAFIRDELVSHELGHDSSRREAFRVEKALMNCADGVMCEGR